MRLRFRSAGMCVVGCAGERPIPRLSRSNPSRLRHAKGISQEDLAYEGRVNRTYLSKLEKGVSYPGLEIIAKLATVLGVEPAGLLRISSGPNT